VPNRRQADIEIGAQKAAALKAAVSDKKDPRAWAHKILERHANGDSSLAPVTIQFAKEALNKPAFGGNA
jgi:6-phosphogluconolactonase/glucosamine-6-phosphate isomerase/deaminase